MKYVISTKLKKRRPETLGIEPVNQELINLVGRFKRGEVIDSDDCNLDELISGGFIELAGQDDEATDTPGEVVSGDEITEEVNNASTN